jgi:hypothetical protein
MFPLLVIFPYWLYSSNWRFALPKYCPRLLIYPTGGIPPLGMFSLLLIFPVLVIFPY